jgi:hypothetical protein
MALQPLRAVNGGTDPYHDLQSHRHRDDRASSRAAGSSSISLTTVLRTSTDFFDLVPAADTDASVDGYEWIDKRPRVRVYGFLGPL